MRLRIVLILLSLLTILSFPMTGLSAHIERLDGALRARIQKGDRGVVRVIIRTKGAPANLDPAELEARGGQYKRAFWAVNAVAADVDVQQLDAISKMPGVEGVSEDQRVTPFNDITVKTVGADIARRKYWVDGSGIGVAVLDTGISAHGDDLDGHGWQKNRVVAQWNTIGSNGDASESAGSAADNFGHGTHVAGIIAGDGDESNGVMAGIAPGANLINVKVLGDDGSGYVSDVMEGIQWVIQNRDRYNIRVMNLSMGHPVTESYKTDPLTQACEAAVKAGIVVVVAAGNYGEDQTGHIVYGGITSPGNDPMVVTVGATKSEGTPIRSDDAVANYSSRGPTEFDLLSKPDLVAPGNRVKSIADPSPNKSDLYDLYPQNRVDPSYYGKPGSAVHYYTLSGTSMAAPVVVGTVALMLDANPTLTPNLVKAILMATSQDLGLPFVVQGAGYLNTYGALMLANDISRNHAPYGTPALRDRGLGLQTQNQIQGENIVWSGNVIWGNNVLWGGMLENNLPLWDNQTAWGSGTVLWNSGTVLWNSGTVLWNSGTVLWNSSNTLWSASVVWGGNSVWGSNYIGTSAVESTDPVQNSNIVWNTNTIWDSGTVLWNSGTVLWNSGTVLWNSSVLINGEN